MMDVPPTIVAQAMQEAPPARRASSDAPAGRADGIQVIDGKIRRSGPPRLPQGGPSGLRTEQLAAATKNKPPVTDIYDKDGLHVRWYLQGGIDVDTESNLFWNLAAVYSPQSKFNSDETWVEGYVTPGIGFDKTLSGGDVFYGKISGVASRTWGTDAFDSRNQGAITLEEGYLGFRTEGKGTKFDLSLGPRELVLGSGMLIANGGVNGFERGALKFGPRKAWKQAAIGRIINGRQTITGYFIEPRELKSNNGHNQLAGVDFRYDASNEDFLGFTYINALKSQSPYIRAAPGGIGAPIIIPDGRDKTNVINLYFKGSRDEGTWRNWFITGDLAYEWNNRINMSAWAARGQIGYTFADTPWKPTLIYTTKFFSGDNPNTPKLERFDPLYYEGSPGIWATGAESSMVFINTNLKALEFSAAVQPSQKITVTLRYAYISADKLESPLQFGQATRLVSTPSGFNLIDGVTKHHLSDDLFLEYNQILTENLFLTIGLAASFPGAGIKAEIPGKAPTWTGAFANVVFNF